VKQQTCETGWPWGRARGIQTAGRHSAAHTAG